MFQIINVFLFYLVYQYLQKEISNTDIIKDKVSSISQSNNDIKMIYKLKLESKIY